LHNDQLYNTSEWVAGGDNGDNGDNGDVVEDVNALLTRNNIASG
jgi:hypothetical protein